MYQLLSAAMAITTLVTRQDLQYKEKLIKRS